MHQQDSPPSGRAAGALSHACALAAVAVAGLMAGAEWAVAQSVGCTTHSAYCPPDPNVNGAAQSGLFDLGTKFLTRLGNEGSQGFGSAKAPGNSAAGGGAPGDSTEQRFRTWAEAYGWRIRTRDSGGTPGDVRDNYGGVAGFGVTVAPGVSLGFAVDQGKTTIDMSAASQSGGITLTQLGANATVELDAWTVGLAAIHGFGRISSQRTAPLGGTSMASYDARLWGAVGEVSRTWTFGDWRVVPKVGMDWMRTDTDAFVETGGFDPAAASAVTGRRLRAFGGFELGRTWFTELAAYDLAGYARAVDILSENRGSMLVTSAFSTPRSIVGIAESRLGVDAGLSASARLSQALRLYAIYDGRFRTNMVSHGGTLGVEFKW